MQKQYSLLLVVGLFVPLSSFADTLSFPSGANTKTQTEVCTYLSRDYRSNACYLSATQGPSSTISRVDSISSSLASVDLTTGILRASAKGTKFVGSEGVGYEFLSFDTGSRSSANISYNFAVDGTLLNTATRGSAEADLYFGFFDVTGLTNYFTTQQVTFRDAPPITITSPSRAASLVASNTAYFIAYGSQDPNLVYDDPTDPSFHLYASEDGSTLPIASNLSGTFNVLPGHTYLAQVQIDADLYKNVSDTSYQAVDFSHTAAFSFTDLDDTTFQSSSGTFLSVVPTPEPSSLLLLSTGALGLTTLVRRKSRR